MAPAVGGAGGRGRRAALLLVLAALLGCAARRCAAAPRRPRGATLRAPPGGGCAPSSSVSSGDTVRAHYRSSYRPGGAARDAREQLEDTSYVGRPVSLRAGGDALLRDASLPRNIGFDAQALLGACVGEERRVIVPRGALEAAGGGAAGALERLGVPADAAQTAEALIYDVEVLEIEGGGMMGADEADAADRAGGAGDTAGRCGPCLTVLVDFYVAWVELVRGKAARDNAAAAAAGSRPPALTYDAEIEDFVQGFCEETLGRKNEGGKKGAAGRVKSDAYAPAVRDECRALMKHYKREWVGKFLSSSIDPKQAGERVWDVCSTLAGVCTAEAAAEAALPAPRKECDACVAFAGLAAMEHATAAAHRVASPSAIGVQVLEAACERAALLYPNGGRMREFCEDILLDNTGALARHLSTGGGQGEGLAKWLCVEQAEMCGSPVQVDASPYAAGAYGGYADGASNPITVSRARDEL